MIVLEGPPAPYRETLRAAGWPVELFVHTDESIAYWFERERQQGVCTLANMIATGQPLGGPDAETLTNRAQVHIDAGPPAWTADQVELRRYLLTDALDDLAGARDADERDVVAGQVLTMTAELRLATAGCWQGKGKWLLRRLRECDPELAQRLLPAHRTVVAAGDISALTQASEAVLAPLGGRLTEGFAVR